MVAIAVLVSSLQGYAVSLDGLRHQVDPPWWRAAPLETALFLSPSAASKATTSASAAAGCRVTVSPDVWRSVRPRTIMVPDQLQTEGLVDAEKMSA
ncbi:hypothetical protein I1E95_02090 [Synechococcus sp. CBW1107]|uniref:hypothetical protein n=1 Tax=Synechococcus sp. CBW1107 TaxID=2789857 RepID=UPI0018CCF2E9|nr:hypothetical protein [Synechococcus sp. CBW1107]QPN56992.1 hypothetical protein I1E95_02090 [Synechococcus sp. CBW1107]